MATAPKDIEAKVKKIIAENLAVEPNRITPETTLIDDLGADSLDMVELTMACEEEFGIMISDDEAEKVVTVQDMENLLNRLLNS